MPHTFDIRFVRSAGLAGVLEAPANSFHWKGDGRLSIDAQGLSIAVRRGLLSLFARGQTRRIAAANLQNVYREGDALRLEFATTQLPRAVVSCWAEDADAAAEIVGLLPTKRTVELEHQTRKSASAGFRFDRRVLTLLAVLALALAGILIAVQRQTSSGPAALPPLAGTPSITVAPPAAQPLPIESLPAPELEAIEVTLPEPRLPLSEDLIIPVARGTPARTAAARHLELFEGAAAELQSAYRADRDRLMADRLSPERFAERLDSYEMLWWNVTYRMLDDPAFATPELLGIRATLLGAARHWRNFLHGYAEGMRKGDSVMIAHSFDELAQAEELQLRARLYVR